MTEIKEINRAQQTMPPAIEKFVLHWGEMGTSWGVNRSVGQIHALLYITTKPLTAEDISNQLKLARSNVSNSIKELLNWKLIRRVHIKGDRRDHFEAETDLWTMLMAITDGRKQREIDPTISVMNELADQASQDKQISKEQTQRIENMLDFMGTLNGWYEDMRALPKSKLVTMMKMGKAIVKLIPKGKG